MPRKSAVKIYYKPIMRRTHITDRERVVLAAWFARSNLGQPRPEPGAVLKLLQSRYAVSIHNAVIALCGEFMENDEHEMMFVEEAMGWYNDLAPTMTYSTREAIVCVWPDVAEHFDWKMS